MSFINSKSEAIRKLQAKLFNSRFFTVSVLLHLLLLFVVGGAVIYKQATIPDDFVGGGEEGDSFIAKESAPPPPPPQQQQTELAPSTPTKTQFDDVLKSDNAEAIAYIPPTITPVVPTTTTDTSKVAPPPAPKTGLSKEQYAKIGQFTGGWKKKGPRGRGSSPKDAEFEFVAYLAKYSGGDWDSTNRIDTTGKIVKGSLPNLLFFMGKFSKGKIKANPLPEPLDLSSQDIFVKKPPFIFFTGHRDFVLTDKEVENLRGYVQLGGCIWGDSSLPGNRSRFDLAFRREMRRVLPDVDKEWEVLPPNSPLYKGKLYYPEIQTPPPGVNHYAEPVYCLRFGTEVAVIYTANDYGDMWRIALTDKLVIDKTMIPRSWEMMYTDDGIFQRMEIYYRGMDLSRIINSYKFGTNLVIHLLTRWEDQVKTPPAGL